MKLLNICMQSNDKCLCFSLSQSGQNRLSVTKNFVEKHGQADEIYHRAKKTNSPLQKQTKVDCGRQNEADPEHVGQSSPAGRNIETRALISQRRPNQPQCEIEDEISECKVNFSFWYNFAYEISIIQYICVLVREKSAIKV